MSGSTRFSGRCNQDDSSAGGDQAKGGSVVSGAYGADVKLSLSMGSESYADFEADTAEAGNLRA